MSLFCALVEGFIGDFGRETDIDVRGGATALPNPNVKQNIRPAVRRWGNKKQRW
jgi:hypothetical protein